MSREEHSDRILALADEVLPKLLEERIMEMIDKEATKKEIAELNQRITTLDRKRDYKEWKQLRKKVLELKQALWRCEK